MWITKKLEEIKRISYSIIKKENGFRIYNNKTGMELGYYKTREKAEKVLNTYYR